MCSKCSSQQVYRIKMCKPCWRKTKKQQYHCTWNECLRPVFALTLCRHQYRAWNVPCAHEKCNRMSYCRQVCAHHYRKKQFAIVRRCKSCTRPSYMQDLCFYHYTSRQCCECSKVVFSRRRCQRHYMKWWRNQRANKGSTISNDTTPEIVNDNPDTTNHIPEIQSS